MKFTGITPSVTSSVTNFGSESVAEQTRLAKGNDWLDNRNIRFHFEAIVKADRIKRLLRICRWHRICIQMRNPVALAPTMFSKSRISAVPKNERGYGFCYGIWYATLHN